MRRLRSVGLILLGLASSAGCVDSSVVLHVFPDGHGHAVVTSRLYEAGLRAFDSMFPGSPKATPLDQELPPPDEGDLAKQFGTRVKLASSKFERTPDGAMRTSVVEFADVTALRMQFPPVFATPSGSYIGIDGISDAPLISFATRPHDNGDRLLLVRLPDQRVDAGPNPDVTVFKTDSPEEQAFKRGIKSMAVRFYVEMEEVPLLRSNAPVMKGNRATILDLDLDRIINNLDEEKVRRAVLLGSMQEMLWQLGDMPGAVVPTDHEVFLEFQPPQPPPAAPPAAPPAQAPPDTEIYLAPIKTANGAIEVGTPINITNNPGYDNQPFFTSDGASVLFTSMRSAAAGAGAAAPQTDIYRYDITAKRVSQVTSTPESEYSPTITPSGAISVIRVELDGNNTQRLWQFTMAGGDPKVVLENVKPVGYHAWIDDHTLALFILGGAGQPATLQLADTRTGASRIVATDIGRSVQAMPGKSAPRDVSFVQRERTPEATRLVIKKLAAASGEIATLTPAVEGGTDADIAWMPDGTLLMARGGTLYAWRPGQPGWNPVADLQKLSLSGVTRLAVSPTGNYLALVGSPRQSR